MALCRVAVLALLVAAAAAAPAAEPVPAEDAGSTSASGISGGLHVLYNSLAQCEQSEDMGACLKLKAIRSLERALSAGSVELVDGLSLSRAEATEAAAAAPGARALDDVPAFEERALPQDAAAKAEVLDDLLADRARRLFQTRTISFAVPRSLRALADGGDDDEDARQMGEEAVESGRKRGKKGGGLLMMGLLWKGWMTMMAYKGVAVLAGKALMTATVALVLAGILALSKLAHGGGGGHEKSHTTVEIVRHPHVTHSYSHSASHEHADEHGHGWGRALEEEQRRRRERGQRHEPTATGVTGQGMVQPIDAQEIAYRAHYQRQVQQQQQQQQQQVQQMQQVQYQPQQQAPHGEAMTVPL